MADPPQRVRALTTSHCPGCAHPIRPYDTRAGRLLLRALRGRRRDCSAGISARHSAVELLTGVLFAAVTYRIGPAPALPAYLYLTAVGIALAAINLDHRRLPDGDRGARRRP
jgi:leader peptidase (prepilin peptidase)/N-methyltransferase